MLYKVAITAKRAARTFLGIILEATISPGTLRYIQIFML